MSVVNQFPRSRPRRNTNEHETLRWTSMQDAWRDGGTVWNSDLGRFGCVYFVEAPEVNRVKIGFTDKRPESRVKELQTGSPVKLCLAGVVPGYASAERKFHVLFAAQRVIGEWFHKTELMDNVVRKQTFSDLSADSELSCLRPMEFAALCESYKPLADLALQVAFVPPVGDEKTCMTRAWYGAGGVKERLCGIVGFDAKFAPPELRTSRAYDVCYDMLYWLLPLCPCCNGDKR